MAVQAQEKTILPVLGCEDGPFFYHEPRAFWTVQQIQAVKGLSTSSQGRVVVPDNDFFNRGKYPITLTDLLICGIGYTFRDLAVPNPVPSAAYVRNTMSAIGEIDVLLSAPFSQYLYRFDSKLASFPAKPVNEPGMRYSANPNASGLWGLSRWEFAWPMRLPRQTTIQFDVSGLCAPGFLGAFTLPRLVTNFEERHTGRFGGDSRFKESAVLPLINPVGAAWFPRAPQPLPADGFGLAAGNFNGTWQPQGFFRGRDWNQQDSDRGQATTDYTALSVAIDQLDYDAAIAAANANFVGQPVAPLSTRVATRARVINGGTGEWWWAEGCPLALIAPTIGIAQRFQLPVPIVLGPGEKLEMELQAPVGVTVTIDAEPVLVQPTYNIGVSLLGYATVQ